MVQIKIDVLGQDVCIKIRLNPQVISDDIEMFIKIAELAVEQILWNNLKLRKQNYTEEFYIEFDKLLVTIPKDFFIDWENDIDKQVKTYAKEIKDRIELLTYQIILPMLKSA